MRELLVPMAGAVKFGRSDASRSLSSRLSSRLRSSDTSLVTTLSSRRLVPVNQYVMFAFFLKVPWICHQFVTRTECAAVGQVLKPLDQQSSTSTSGFKSPN